MSVRLEEQLDEGEIKIIDNEHYIVSNDELFKFEHREGVQINWGQVMAFDDQHQEAERLQQSYEKFKFGSPEEPAQDVDATSHILANLGSIAYCDMEKDRNGRWLNHDAKKLMKVIQYGLQYYMFAQKHMTAKVH